MADELRAYVGVVVFLAGGVALVIAWLIAAIIAAGIIGGVFVVVDKVIAAVL